MLRQTAAARGALRRQQLVEHVEDHRPAAPRVLRPLIGRLGRERELARLTGPLDRDVDAILVRRVFRYPQREDEPFRSLEGDETSLVQDLLAAASIDDRELAAHSRVDLATH